MKDLLLCVVLQCSVVAVGLASYSEAKFHLVTNQTLGISHPGVQLRAGSKVACAGMCTKHSSNCRSFLYNTKTKLCTLGSWATKLQQPRDLSRTELLFSDSCLFKTGCSFDSSVDATLCFWLSEVKQNYSTAESDCKDKGSHLLTLKTQERASQFFEVIKPLEQKFWIGLNDLVEENVFRWADDKSTLTQGMRDILFHLGQPNDLNNEDCVEYNPNRYPCNDDRCESKKRYVCEVTPGFRC